MLLHVLSSLLKLVDVGFLVVYLIGDNIGITCGCNNDSNLNPYKTMVYGILIGVEGGVGCVL